MPEEVQQPKTDKVKKVKKKKKIKELQQERPRPRMVRLNQSMAAATGDGGQVPYQDIVMDEDPIKLRRAVQDVEYKVATIATPSETAAGTGSTLAGNDKGQGLYFVPPTKGTLGTFVGMRKVTSTFTNLSDEPIVVVGAYPKNWSGIAKVVDTVEGFRLEIPAGKARTVKARLEWNFPLYPSQEFPMKDDTGSTVSMPFRALLLRYYVHASDAWSEKYKASLLKEGTGGATNTVAMAYKDVTAYKRTDVIEYCTINGVVDDESSQKLLGLFTFPNFMDVGKINGTGPQPAYPKNTKIKGRIGSNDKTTTVFGNMGTYSSGDSATVVNCSFNLGPAEKKGLGIYPVDYYDSDYGWGAYLYLAQWSLEDIQEDKAPEPWLNTYTTPDYSHNSRVEWEIPALGSLTLDETNDDTACVAGRYKYWTDIGAYVLWDHIREKPALVGNGYNSVSGKWKFYVPKMFCLANSAIVGIDPPDFTRDRDFEASISWFAVLDIVSTIVEVLYVVGKALYEHYAKEEAMFRHMMPLEYKEQMDQITKAAANRLGDMRAQQVAKYGEPKLPRRDGGPLLSHDAGLDRQATRSLGHARTLGG